MPVSRPCTHAICETIEKMLMTQFVSDKSIKVRLKFESCETGARSDECEKRS